MEWHNIQSVFHVHLQKWAHLPFLAGPARVVGRIARLLLARQRGALETLIRNDVLQDWAKTSALLGTLIYWPVNHYYCCNKVAVTAAVDAMVTQTGAVRTQTKHVAGDSLRFHFSHAKTGNNAYHGLFSSGFEKWKKDSRMTGTIRNVPPRSISWFCRFCVYEPKYLCIRFNELIIRIILSCWWCLFLWKFCSIFGFRNRISSSKTKQMVQPKQRGKSENGQQMQSYWIDSAVFAYSFRLLL